MQSPADRRSERSRPEGWRASDIVALVAAGLQTVLPYTLLIIGAAAATYFLVALFFRG